MVLSGSSVTTAEPMKLKKPTEQEYVHDPPNPDQPAMSDGAWKRWKEVYAQLRNRRFRLLHKMMKNESRL